MEQVNKHLSNIALKHAAHDPSKTSHFIRKEGRGQGASNILLLIVMRHYITRCNECKFFRLSWQRPSRLFVWVLILCSFVGRH